MTPSRSRRMVVQSLGLVTMLVLVGAMLTLVGDGPEPASVLGTSTVRVPGHSLSRREANALWDEVLFPPELAAVSSGSADGCVVGAVDDAFGGDQTARINGFRRLAGLDPVAWDDDLQQVSQRAALWVAANQRLDHEPDPSSVCHRATLVGESSAIEASLVLLGRPRSAIRTYLADVDPANTPVPNRRRLLHPAASAIGAGWVASGDTPGHAIAVRTDDAWDHPVAWPPAGDLPVGLWMRRWSLTVGDPIGDATVSVHRNGVEVDVTVVHLSEDGFPGSAVVFDLPDSARPDRIDDTIYDVRILVEGGTTTYLWSTTFFSASGMPSPPTSSTGASDDLIRAAYRDLAGNLQPTGPEIEAARRASFDEFVEGLIHSDAWIGRRIEALYLETLGRAPDAGGLAHWTERIRSGAQDLRSVAAEFYGSPEYRGRFDDDEAWLASLFANVLGQPSDPEGRGLYLERLASGASPAIVAREVYQSPESRAHRVDVLYLELQGRAPDPAEREFWAEELLLIDDLDLAVDLVTSIDYRRRNA